ncbi:MAG: 5-oxoprolinase subunit PxpB [Rhodospirillales bacterium]|nr:5-oxoprolinase subunit PxpB [Rhodospirillales bacterium]
MSPAPDLRPEPLAGPPAGRAPPAWGASAATAERPSPAAGDGPRSRPIGNPAPPRFRPLILPVGDTALTVDFGDAIDPLRNRAVLALEQSLAAAELPGILETVPSYRALMIVYDPAEIGFGPLAEQVRARLDRLEGRALAPRRRWVVPVAYDPPFGLDLDELSQALGLPAEAILSRHATPAYSVYMVGFAPGFTYLGGLDPALAVPRRASPRPIVPAGSVMIGGQQAAIVSVPIPTGWYVIGRTPMRAFDPDRADPFMFRPGDRVRFRPVRPAEFARLAALPADELRILAREDAACQDF